MITHLIGIFPEATQCSTVAFMNLGIQDRDTCAEKVAGQKQARSRIFGGSIHWFINLYEEQFVYFNRNYKCPSSDPAT